MKLTSGIYDDRKDTLIRDMDGRREELDGIAARLVLAFLEPLTK